MNNTKFEEIKPILKKYFTKYYGQEYKDIIESRIDNIVSIFPERIEDFESSMNRKLSEKKIELTIRFLKENNVDISPELEQEVLKSNMTVSLPDSIKKMIYLFFNTSNYSEPMNYDFRYIFTMEPTEFIHKRREDFLKKMGAVFNDYHTFIKSDDAKPFFDKINFQLDLLSKLDIEYKKIEDEYIETKKILSNAKEIKSKIEEKNRREYIESIRDFLALEDQALLDTDYRERDLKSVELMIPDNLNKPSLIEYFSLDSFSKLEDKETFEFTKKGILSQQERYFKILGLLEDDVPFSSFQETDIYKENLPSQEVINFITNRREYFIEKSKVEYLEATSSYKRDMETISLLNLDGFHSYDLDLIQIERLALINPCFKENGEIVPLLVYNASTMLPNYCDVTFIHEINHIVELELLRKEGRNLTYKCGFEEIKENLDINKDNYDRPFESFSEVINQMIAMEITALMHEDGVYLIDNPKTAQVARGVEYERNIIIVREFFENYKDEILKSRTGKNLEPIFNSFGRENFIELNDLVNQYSSLPMNKLMFDIIEKRDTELTRKREEIIRRARDISNNNSRDKTL